MSMTTTTDIMAKKIAWDTTYAKEKAAECVDKAAELSRENAKRSNSVFIPFLFNSILTMLYFPVPAIKSAIDYLTGKVTPTADAAVDSAVRRSSDVAKRSTYATIDSSATASQRIWNWFN